MANHQEVKELEKTLIGHYLTNIKEAINEIDNGTKPSLFVKTLNGAIYKLLNGRLHKNGPEEVYIERRNHPISKDSLGTLSGLLNLARSDVKEASNLYYQLC